MVVPAISELRREHWASAPIEDRWQALNDLEKALSTQEAHRDACPIKPMPENLRVIGQDGKPLLRGYYDRDEKAIYIDPILVEKDEPYAAVETTFHEARHAYQHFAIQHPGVHPDQQQTEDWAENYARGVYNDGSYTEMDYTFYRWQPVEADARKIARNRTDELYETVYQDHEYYSYKTQRERELAMARFQDQKSLLISEASETEIESELERVGREEMHHRYLRAYGEVSSDHMQFGDSSEFVGAHNEETATQLTGRTDAQVIPTKNQSFSPEANSRPASQLIGPDSEQSPARPASEEAAPAEGKSEAETVGETASEPSEGYDYYSGYGY